MGEEFDQYLPPADGAYHYREVGHGEADLPAGDVVLRYTVTGKNAASAAYTLATDQILLTPAPALTLTGKDRLAVGEKATYQVEFVQFAEYYADAAYVLWTVEQESEPGVLVVGQDGRVEAVRRGTAVVRARSQIADQATATLTVTVA